jgi:sugar fermentation stimulation protein A
VGPSLGEEPRRRPHDARDAVSHRPAALQKVRLPVRADLRGRLVRRYKRFLADVELPSGEIVTVHCPNPGRMQGTDTPGSAVRCSTSDNPKRKLRHTLEMIRVGRIWVGLHTLRANQLVARTLEARAIPCLSGYQRVEPEVSVGGGSRLDFRLNDHRGDEPPAYVEVKSVTLAEGRLARFPDAVTTRGRRHMDTLVRLHKEGSRAAVLFVTQRADCDLVEPADDIDPEYGRALRAAAAAGVEVLAVGARVTGSAITLERSLPVRL